MNERLHQQIQFIQEIDQLKLVLRQSLICGGERRENSAEHSWHLAMLALTLAEHADEPVDISRVMQMVLIHDIVEIDAGDTFIYDTSGMKEKAAKEQQAAERLFGLLPVEQGQTLIALWHEFEANETADAKFANALDRTIPLLHNVMAKGGSWQKHNVTRDMVDTMTPKIHNGSKALGAYVETVLDDAVARGYLKE